MPEVAALEAADSGDQDRLTVGAANGLSRLPRRGRLRMIRATRLAELLAHRALNPPVVARGASTERVGPSLRMPAARDSRRSQLCLPAIMDLRSQLPVVELVYASHEIRPSGGSSPAAALAFACATVRAPGITVVTPGCCATQASAACAGVASNGSLATRSANSCAARTPVS